MAPYEVSGAAQVSLAKLGDTAAMRELARFPAGRCAVASVGKDR
jgi:hypothetical protein